MSSARPIRNSSNLSLSCPFVLGCQNSYLVHLVVRKICDLFFSNAFDATQSRVSCYLPNLFLWNRQQMRNPRPGNEPRNLVGQSTHVGYRGPRLFSDQRLGPAPAAEPLRAAHLRQPPHPPVCAPPPRQPCVRY